jgi:hypothetical protein
MTAELRLARMDLRSTGRTYDPVTPRKRNLGAAIFVAAIRDYRSIDEALHEDAKRFLYAQTTEWQDHYDWAVGLTIGFNPVWLRDGLDRLKDKWDSERMGCSAAQRRGERNAISAKRGEQANGDEQNCSKVLCGYLHTGHTAAQPAGETDSARAGGAPPCA